MKNITCRNIHLSCLSFFFLIGAFSGLSAQTHSGSNDKVLHEKIRAEQSAFITTKLDLSVKEARDFWPVYDEYKVKKTELYLSWKSKCNQLWERADSLTKSQLEDLADCQLQKEQALLDLKKEYHTKFKTVLPDQKVAKLYLAEWEFKMMLMKRMRGHEEKDGGHSATEKAGNSNCHDKSGIQEEHKATDSNSGPSMDWDF